MCFVVCPVTMKELLKILKPAASKWKILAVNLDLENGDISRIDQDSGNVEDKLIDVLSMWMGNVSPEKNNWSTIHQAVKDTTSFKSLANHIKVKFMKC